MPLQLLTTWLLLQAVAAQVAQQAILGPQAQLQTAWELAEAEAAERLIPVLLVEQVEPEDFQAAAAAAEEELKRPVHPPLLQVQVVQVATQKLEFGYLDEQLFCN
jgi:hypothetical protein